MFWTIVLWAIGAAIALGALVVFLGWFVGRHECPAAQLGQAVSAGVEALLPIPRSEAVRDKESIARLAAFLADNKQDPTPMPFPLMRLQFTLADGKTRKVEASQFGWNWPWEKRNSRKLTDSLKFCEFVDSLLPAVTESDMDSIEIPEEDLSGFDDTKIPEDLRHLIPLAKKWGVGDDLIRSEVVRRATIAERRELMEKVPPLEERICQFIESLGMPSVENPMSDECCRLMYMLEASGEILPEQLGERGEASIQDQDPHLAPRPKIPG